MLLIGRMPASLSRRCIQYGLSPMVMPSISPTTKRGFSSGLVIWMAARPWIAGPAVG